MKNSKRNCHKIPPGFCRRPDGLVVEEEFLDTPRRLFAAPSISVADTMLITMLTPTLASARIFSFTVGFWIGALCYGRQKEVVLTFERFQFCREEAPNVKIYEMQMTFIARHSPDVAKWLLVDDEVVRLYGYLIEPDNYIHLFIDRQHAVSVLDYGKEKTE